MVAQTVTERLGVATVSRLVNLQREVAGSAPIMVGGDSITHTVTIVYNAGTGAITVDYSNDAA